VALEIAKSGIRVNGVAPGPTDVIIYTVNSFILQQNLPNAQLIIDPDSAHGSHHQYPELFVRHASMFLSGEEGREYLSFENGRPFATLDNQEDDHAQSHR
jgi:NAD(P)-dependent dehydrogenase (short-subunit alcohol dehydrogenase family)